MKNIRHVKKYYIKSVFSYLLSIVICLISLSSLSSGILAYAFDIEPVTTTLVGIQASGSYSSLEDVAYYIHKYKKLPDNYITKEKARQLGWPGGSLEPYAPGKCIGGNYYGNYEGLLAKADGRKYYECDIDTLGADSRGAKRLVYSNDGMIYYTEDHYASFSLVYNASGYTQTQKFIIRLYEKCLGRSYDPDGMNHWNACLIAKERSGAQVAYGFVFSKEYLNKNTSDEVFVEMLYNVFLNRQSDPAGKQHWLDLLNEGVSREYIFRGFAQSVEYTKICESYGIERGTYTLTQPRDQNINITRYVTRMYSKALGRKGDIDGINHWCREILTKSRTPEQVAESFINSQEFRNKNLSNEEYIKILYRTFLGREYDQAGLEHWIGELNRGCTRDEILHRFATSAEFRNIQAQFGL